MGRSAGLKRTDGNIITYILIGIFLLGLLTLAVSEGPKKSAVTMQLDQTIQGLISDLNTLESSLNQCALLNPTPVDIDASGTIDTTDNPNAPYPLRFLTGTGYGTTGLLSLLVCPAIPPTPLQSTDTANNNQLVFPASKNHFKLLSNTTTYTATYTTSTTEGVYVEIRNNAATNTLWLEAATRANARLSACKVALTTAPGPCSATNPCLFYWIKRPATSAIGMPEAGCTL